MLTNMNWRAKLNSTVTIKDAADEDTEPFSGAARAMLHARREMTEAARLLTANGSDVAVRSRIDEWIELTRGSSSFVVRQLADAVIVERAGLPPRPWAADADFAIFVHELDKAIEWLIDVA